MNFTTPPLESDEWEEEVVHLSQESMKGRLVSQPRGEQ